jgi:hypothetical protein
MFALTQPKSSPGWPSVMSSAQLGSQGPRTIQRVQHHPIGPGQPMGRGAAGVRPFFSIKHVLIVHINRVQDAI